MFNVKSFGSSAFKVVRLGVVGTGLAIVAAGSAFAQTAPTTIEVKPGSGFTELGQVTNARERNYDPMYTNGVTRDADSNTSTIMRSLTSDRPITSGTGSDGRTISVEFEAQDGTDTPVPTSPEMSPLPEANNPLFGSGTSAPAPSPTPAP